MVLSSIPHSTSQIDARLKLYLIEMPRRVAFVDVDHNHVMNDSGVDNPFRPGSELSREADIIVNLIKEGKPITPTKETVDSPNGFNAINGKKDMNLLEKSPEMNGTPKSRTPAVVEVQHSLIIPPQESKQVAEEVNLKKKRKCCTIQ
ncbi:uncharacterized protein LOC128951778 [Oppia nitens]|uniref:uncharacterized protein LOC128951778 n=1 Tax=Oppia nitens TaxID=1686743 RepID=UPI0023DB1937|nr:uncharacterized protein LOC128951778 [Oppia nitens]